jgi:hypothetical protein
MMAVVGVAIRRLDFMATVSKKGESRACQTPILFGIAWATAIWPKLNQKVTLDVK